MEGQNVPEAVSTDDGFITIDPDVIPIPSPDAAEVEAMLVPEGEATPEEKPSALSQIPTDEKEIPSMNRRHQKPHGTHSWRKPRTSR